MNQGKERSLDTFIAGLIGGYVVFGERNAVNEQVRVHDWAFLGDTFLTLIHLLPFYGFAQIVLYVVSRVVASFIPRASTAYHTAPDSALSASTVKPLPPDSKYFTVFAALSWGAVMWLFRHRGETIQPGMFNSMKYLYLDSNAWKDLRTLFWHNT
jgi:peroxisomal membrane protein 4